MNLFGLANWFEKISNELPQVTTKTVQGLGKNVLQRSNNMIFKTQGAYRGGGVIAEPEKTPAGIAGQRWQPFSANTFKINPKRKGGKLLQDTGALRLSIKGYRTQDGLQWGSKYKYAGFHQYGANLRVFGKYPAKLPSRPFVYVTKNDYTRMQQILSDAIEKVWK
jgi:phage virion morphogenesis protein